MSQDNRQSNKSQKTTTATTFSSPSSQDQHGKLRHNNHHHVSSSARVLVFDDSSPELSAGSTSRFKDCDDNMKIAQSNVVVHRKHSYKPQHSHSLRYSGSGSGKSYAFTNKKISRRCNNMNKQSFQKKSIKKTLF